MKRSHLINPQLGHKSHNSSGDAGFSCVFQPSSASLSATGFVGVLPSSRWSSSLPVSLWPFLTFQDRWRSEGKRGNLFRLATM